MNDRAIRQKKRRGGFTLAEFLVVIAIIMILAGVSFVAAIRYQSRLRRLEMDQTAKEIFLAAQNQLSLSQAEGAIERLLKTGADTEEKLGIPLTAEGQDGIYCVLYQPGEEERCGEIRNRLLPFGSIDETVRTDGSYLIFYEPGAGAVRAVWYSDRYVFVEDDIESTMLSEAAADPDKREHYTGANEAFAGHGQPVGYYGGDSVENPMIDPDTALETPDVKIVNNDILYACVNDPNMMKTIGNSSSYQIQLYLEGLSSGAKGWIDLKSADGRIQKQWTSGGYQIILDDITTPGHHFADLNKDVGSIVAFENEKRLIPGEDIRLYAQASISGKTGSTVTSASKQENSLFAGKRTDKVLIGSIRHLENLDYKISGFNPDRDASELELQPQTAADGTQQYTALQQKHISWTEFCGFVQPITNHQNPSICYRENGKQTGAGYFAPVEPQFALHYDGNTRSIANIPVKTAGEQPGGVFGSVTKNLTVSRLKVVAADITSAASGGALIGAGSGADLKITVDNVMIQYPKVLTTTKKYPTDTKEIDAGAVIGNFDGKELTIRRTMAANTYHSGFSAQADSKAPADLSAEVEKKFRIRASYGIAGGLAGAVKQGTVTISDSAAAVYVDGGDYAGGLIGAARGASTVSIDSCYVGGHTANKKFLTDPVPGEIASDAYDGTQGRFNIVSRSTYAGGLAGMLPDSSSISHTYVSASVYSATYGDVANPAAGEDGALTIPEADAPQKQGAFVARYVSPAQAVRDGAAADALQFSCCYTSALVNGRKALVYPETLKDFFESETRSANKAYPYDQTLGAVYPMPTVFRLNKQDASSSTAGIPGLCAVHVGDWQEFQAESTADKMKLHNGNRLWLDYEISMPEDTGTATNPAIKYLTYSIAEKPEDDDDDDEENWPTVYYVVAVNCRDLSATQYVVLDNANNVAQGKWNENGVKTLDNPSRRIEFIYENGKTKIRLYLDNLSVSSAAYQALPSLNNSGNLKTLKAGADIRVRVCEELRVPNRSDKYADDNSMFAGVQLNEDKKTYTAFVSNIRHLENLNFFHGDDGINKIEVTKAVQTDNILWQEDAEVSSNTEAYCKEIAEAYPNENVGIYGGNSKLSTNGSFYPIMNEELQSYDGGGYTISKLNVGEFGGKGSALFQKNSHLTISRLNLKDPVIETSQAAAGIIAEAAGNQYSGDWNESHLYLSDVHVYGNDMRIRGGSITGGIAANVSVNKFRMENVSVYGRNALVGSKNGSGDIGGLIGSLRADEEMHMQNSMFSGYLSGKNIKSNAGGLIGKLDVSQKNNEAGNTKIVLENCYVAGRNAAYPYSDYIADDQLQNGNNISGAYNVGGLIGYGLGALRISNCFSMAGVRSYTQGYQSGVGGLIGKYEKSGKLQIVSCYSGGFVSKDGGGADPKMGCFIGYTDTTGPWNNMIPQINLISDCAYIAWDGLAGIKPIATSTPESIDGVTPCIPGQETMSGLLPSSDAEKAEQTYSYEMPMTASYPYKIWTTEPDESGNQRRTYRGDWIAQ